MSRNAAQTSHGSHGAPERGRVPNVTSARSWVGGARPRTLPAAIVPVVVGTAVAGADGSVVWWRSLLALVVALGVQIGTNYANDYTDGVRGTDAERLGPRVSWRPGSPLRGRSRWHRSVPSASPA